MVLWKKTGQVKTNLSVTLQIKFALEILYGAGNIVARISGDREMSSVILVILRYIFWLVEKQLQTIPTSGLELA